VPVNLHTLRGYADIGLELTALGYKEYDGGLVHWGPGQIYMSKAPGDIESYTGDGEWFKIAKFGFDITGKREVMLERSTRHQETR